MAKENSESIKIYFPAKSRIFKLEEDYAKEYGREKQRFQTNSWRDGGVVTFYDANEYLHFKSYLDKNNVEYYCPKQSFEKRFLISSSNCNVSGGNLRRIISPMFDLYSNYSLIITKSNPEAVDFLKGKTYDLRDNFDSKEDFEKNNAWDYKKKYGEDYYENKDKGLESFIKKAYYNGSLRNLYENALSMILINTFNGKDNINNGEDNINYASCDLFETGNLMCGDLKDYSLPKLHILKDKPFLDFEKIFNNIPGEGFLSLIKELNGEYRRNMGEAMLLSKAKINPLMITKNCQMDGISLIKAIDFLIPMQIYQNPRIGSHFDE